MCNKSKCRAKRNNDLHFSHLLFFSATELVGPKYRVVIGFVNHIFYSFGYMSLAAIAYFVQEWRYLEAAITAPCICFVVYWWWVINNSLDRFMYLLYQIKVLRVKLKLKKWWN